MEEALQKLNAFIEQKIEEEDSRYSEDYKSSKWYRRPSLKEAVGDDIGRRTKTLKEVLESGNKLRLKEVLDSLEKAAKEYGKSWWDEDLHRERAGYEFECTVCTQLRNIAAEALGLPSADYHDYYEGCSGISV